MQHNKNGTEDWNSKTHTITNIILNERFYLTDEQIEETMLYKYLEHEIHICWGNQTTLKAQNLKMNFLVFFEILRLHWKSMSILLYGIETLSRNN